MVQWIMRGALAAALAIWIGTVACAATPPLLELSGPWLVQSGDNPSWGNVQVNEATGWLTQPVPGTANKTGFTWYRRHFVLPTDWQTAPPVTKYGRLYLHLGALHGAAEIYINGYQVNQLGKMPKAVGGAFQPVAPSSDLTVILPISAKVSGGSTQTLFNWGGDNVIAIRLYDTSPGPNPTSGDISLDLPTPDELYPITFETSQASHLYDPKTPVVYSVVFTNTTLTAASLSWDSDLLDDTGAPVTGYQPQTTTGDIDPGGATSFKSSVSIGDKPGILTFRINSTVAGEQMPSKDFTFGWNTDQIRSDQAMPSGYSAFWADVADEADKAQLSPRVFTSVYAFPYIAARDVSSSEISISGDSTALMFAPRTMPTSPVVIVRISPPGQYAVGQDVSLAERGFVAIDTQGIAGSATPTATSPQQAVTSGIGSPDTYGLRDVVKQVIEAVRALHSTNPFGIPTQSPVVLWGDGQNGAAALIAAALLKNQVSGVVAISPYFCFMSHTLSSVKPQNNPFAQYLADHPGAEASVLRTLSFFDPTFLAPKIAVPVFFSIGLQDRRSPAYSEFATLNAITAPCMADIEPDAGAQPSASFGRAERWLSRTVKQ